MSTMKAGRLTKQAVEIIKTRGQPALSQAINTILESPYDNGVVAEALHYYAREVLPNVLPIFPALIQLSSQVTGQKPENVDTVAAAMMLITASGDIHDDIIDNSKGKFGNKTMFGKYGRETALLAGDLLLSQGFTLLQQEIKELPSAVRITFVASVNSAMIEIVSAEALESALWCKKQVMPEEYFEVIRLKATVAELHCKIGGLLANTNLKTLELLMHYGRAIGILSTLKEEFVDMVNPVELKHRIAHELPPYPMLCALQDEEVGEQLGIFVSKGSLQSKDGGCIAKLVLGCAKVKMMETDFRKLGREEFATNVLLKSEMCRELSVLLEALYKELSVV